MGSALSIRLEKRLSKEPSLAKAIVRAVDDPKALKALGVRIKHTKKPI